MSDNELKQAYKEASEEWHNLTIIGGNRRKVNKTMRKIVDEQNRRKANRSIK